MKASMLSSCMPGDTDMFQRMGRREKHEDRLEGRRAGGRAGDGTEGMMYQGSVRMQSLSCGS
jgi:hypothetical protein